jgi:hypothetical protein
LIDIPPEAKVNWLRANLKAGSVYYFSDDSFSSTDPHYFIVLNPDPLNDPFLALVCASSQIDKVRRRSSHLSLATLVRINPDQYTDFTVPSIIDGNYVHQRSIGELERKIRRGALEIKADMDMTLIKKIRTAVMLSTMIEEEVRDLFLIC